MMANRTVTPTDRACGVLLRKHRRAAGMTLDDLSRALGCSYQQTHKYENGTNRMSAGTVWEVARILQLPITALFPPMTSEPQPDPTPGQKLGQIIQDLRQLEGEFFGAVN